MLNIIKSELHRYSNHFIWLHTPTRSKIENDMRRFILVVIYGAPTLILMTYFFNQRPLY